MKGKGIKKIYLPAIAKAGRQDHAGIPDKDVKARIQETYCLKRTK